VRANSESSEELNPDDGKPKKDIKEIDEYEVLIDFMVFAKGARFVNVSLAKITSLQAQV